MLRILTWERRLNQAAKEENLDPAFTGIFHPLRGKRHREGQPHGSGGTLDLTHLGHDPEDSGTLGVGPHHEQLTVVGREQGRCLG